MVPLVMEIIHLILMVMFQVLEQLDVVRLLQQV